MRILRSHRDSLLGVIVIGRQLCVKKTGCLCRKKQSLKNRVYKRNSGEPQRFYSKRNGNQRHSDRVDNACEKPGIVYGRFKEDGFI